MSDGVEFKFTFDVTSKSEAHVTHFAIQHLRERGYDVALPNEKWETLPQLAKRLGICDDTFYRAIRNEGCPNFATHRTPGGRLREICSNAHFDAYLQRYKSPERKARF